jgi:hypothetical protein
MNIKNMIEALTIVSKYVDPENDWVTAEHDIVCFPLQINETSAEDAQRLRELGAHEDEWGCGMWSTYT